ncbi:MAG: flagellar brake protein [Gammaproteobacteria bacterium]|nr:flagellar brake protein [Gammaproteobacteria bacterium]
MAFFNHFSFPDSFLSSVFNTWKKKKKPVQRSIFDTEETIARLLRQLQQHLVIMTAKFPSDKETYNTAIIKVDYKNKLFYLDELIPDAGNKQIEKLEKILLRTRLDGAILTADCRLKETGKEKGIPHYIMYFPEYIRSIQRRESYRVSIPLSKRIQVNMQTESGAFIAGFLNDISFSGIAIRLENKQNFDLNIGEMVPFLTIHLNETITCEMEVKRISTILGNTIISGHLEEISPGHKRFIQNFITQLDRKKRKQSSN